MAVAQGLKPALIEIVFDEGVQRPKFVLVSARFAGKGESQAWQNREEVRGRRTQILVGLAPSVTSVSFLAEAEGFSRATVSTDRVTASETIVLKMEPTRRPLWLERFIGTPF